MSENKSFFGKLLEKFSLPEEYIGGLLMMNGSYFRPASYYSNNTDQKKSINKLSLVSVAY